MKQFRAGIDIGSTTVKLVVLNTQGKICFGAYRRHQAHTQKALSSLLKDAIKVLGACELRISITGSGSMNLGKALSIPFVQEVVAVATALRFTAPQTDVAIELGGEDAKIIYFRGGLDERMNGVCAGGTGSFIDQMASLLQTDAAGLNEAAASYQQLYPIAARCGVFAKTDIQPLINEGATKADLAASIFQAVVNQTISGLACGKPIRGCVAFLGGPLHFLPELKKAFIRTLHLTPETTIDPDNSHLFAAMGAALEADRAPVFVLSELIDQLQKGVETASEMPRLAPLFENQADFDAFKARHARSMIPKASLTDYTGKCYLGIDAGSTTTKMVLIGEQGQLLFSYYRGNQGNPIETAKDAAGQLMQVLPTQAQIARSCSTGYGESLLKSAFSLDEGVVETIAHCKAAAFFEPDADCVLDIGGQDMKCIRLKNGTVDSILLNEACSSGCGSFIENFASSLGYTAEAFAREALFARSPVDLGTRCTVFMNSNVKQAQKEGAPVSDISAGLAYSVIKNALYKVIKLPTGASLGRHIVVQGGTFHNLAVLRAFEKISGTEAVCPDISGLMGAFGAALTAREHDRGRPSSMLSLQEILDLSYTSSSVRCGGCTNRCMLTINKFPGGRKHISGNRCEKGAGKASAGTRAPNMMEFKRRRLFDAYPPLPENQAPRGTVGLPRALNMYENYPFWAVFFRQLGIRAVLSPFSDRKIYELGMESIPSESECYPAKMVHGHVQWLINQGISSVFHPCIFYEHQEIQDAQNHYNCPMVISYAENIKNNMEPITQGEIRYIRPFIAFSSEKTAADRLVMTAAEEWNVPEKEVRAAVHEAWTAQLQAKEDIRTEGQRLLEQMERSGGRGVILAGRPYHIDPEINHGIPELIASYGLTVFTEDSIPLNMHSGQLRVVDQWVYHSRLYNAAEFAAGRQDLELIQLNSFGCGLDAVTSDQVAEIMEKHNKLYTLLKIDEVNNLGAVRIRIRSLLAAMDMRREKHILPLCTPQKYVRSQFTKQMFRDGYTILAPQMSPIHFTFLEPVFQKHGFHLVVLKNDNRSAIDVGLKYVNNDACFPSITVVGQIMEAVLSGQYDTDKLAIIMSQTGGCCRASNYVAFIRRALDKAGLSHIPVISLNANGMEKNDGFRVHPDMLLEAAQALVYGDLLMRCLYRVRPYEKFPGSANAMYRKWTQQCIRSLSGHCSRQHYKALCRQIVADFDTLPLEESVVKPRVGIVGEILVKYMPLANSHLVDLLEREGAEAVVPDLLDFMNYSFYNANYKTEFLGARKASEIMANSVVRLITHIRKPATDALRNSRRFSASIPIQDIAQATKPFLSLGNQYGEGWFLAGEMVELIQSGTPNIICIQPFACLPNHVVGKGVIKALHTQYPEANIVAVDYDPGASQVNQLNRIKLMLSSAKKQAEKKK